MKQTEKALQRAIKRYQKSKRYVPVLKIIDDDDKPKKVYEYLVRELDIEHFVHLSSDVAIGEPCHIEAMSKDCIWW